MTFSREARESWCCLHAVSVRQADGLITIQVGVWFAISVVCPDQQTVGPVSGRPEKLLISFGKRYSCLEE